MNNNKRLYSLSSATKLDEELIELQKNPTKLIDRGYEFVELGLYEEAFQFFSFGLSIDSSDTDILNGLGITLCELGKLQKSVSVLEHSIRLDPENAITFGNIAGVFWEMGQYDKAIQYYTKSIDLDNEIEEIHLNVINLYMEIGYFYVAFNACIEFQKLFPHNIESEELMEDIILNMAISLY